MGKIILIKKYTIVAIPDVEKLNDYAHADYITKHDVIVERIIATSYLKALTRFKNLFKSGFSINQISFPIEKYSFFEVTKHSKKLSELEIRLQYWNSIEVAATNHNESVLREQYSVISRTAISKINENDPQRILNSLNNEELRDIYDRARSYSFSILQNIAFKSSPYTAWLVLDIGDAFHNHRQLKNNNHNYRDDVMSDLLFYEQWIFTLMELDHFYHFHLFDNYTIQNILADMEIRREMIERSNPTIISKS